MSSQIKCKYDHDDFCFVCGRHTYTTTTAKKSNLKKRFITASKFRESYKAIFNVDPLNRNEQWSPQVVCISCYNQLTIPERKLYILAPMEWMVPKDHPHDCYFCQTVVPPHTTKRRQSEIQYADVPTVKKAKLIDTGSDTHTVYDEEETDPAEMPDFDEDFEVGEASGFTAQSDATTTENVIDAPMDIVEEMPTGINPITSVASSGTFIAPRPVSPAHSCVSGASGNASAQQLISSTPFPSPSSGSAFIPPRHFSFLSPRPPKEAIELTQARLNDYVRDMDLTKENAELHASRLNDLGLGGGMNLFFLFIAPLLSLYFPF